MNMSRIAVLFFAVAVVLSHADETNLTLTVDGVTYSHVTFGIVTPVSVSIRHSTGVARVPLESLPVEFQQKLGYDPQKAATYRAAVSAAQADAVVQAKVAADAAAQAKAVAEKAARAKAAKEEAVRAKAAADALKARYIRKIDDKLYDFTTVERLLIQRSQSATAIQGTHGEEFDNILRQLDAIDSRLKNYNGKYFWGEVFIVADDFLYVNNGNKNGDGGEILVSNYPNAQEVLVGKIIFAPALWITNRRGKRVFDCGTIANDDDLQKLPITQIESAAPR